MEELDKENLDEQVLICWEGNEVYVSREHLERLRDSGHLYVFPDSL